MVKSEEVRRLRAGVLHMQRQSSLTGVIIQMLQADFFLFIQSIS